MSFGATELDGGPWCVMKNPNTGKTIVIKDVIADAMRTTNNYKAGRVFCACNYEFEWRLHF